MIQNKPVVGGKFWYKSRYMESPLEGIIKEVSNDSILSTRGVSYPIHLITFETISDIRDKRLDYLFE